MANKHMTDMSKPLCAYVKPKSFYVLKVDVHGKNITFFIDSYDFPSFNDFFPLKYTRNR